MTLDRLSENLRTKSQLDKSKIIKHYENQVTNPNPRTAQYRPKYQYLTIRGVGGR